MKKFLFFVMVCVIAYVVFFNHKPVSAQNGYGNHCCNPYNGISMCELGRPEIVGNSCPCFHHPNHTVYGLVCR